MRPYDSLDPDTVRSAVDTKTALALKQASERTRLDSGSDYRTISLKQLFGNINNNPSYTKFELLFIPGVFTIRLEYT